MSRFGIVAAWLVLISQTAVASAQTEQSLSDWTVSLDGGRTFRSIAVPGTIEDQIDVDFDGVSIYRTELPAHFLDGSQRVLLRFEAVATHAKVFANDNLIGEHLGGWTPFTVDLTTPIRERDHDRPFVITVEVDERVGHNTQGFLPIVTNHFGGIWQPVTVRQVAAAYIIREAVAVFADPRRPQLSFIVPISRDLDATTRLEVAVAPLTRSGQPGPWEVLSGEWKIYPGSTRILGATGYFCDEVWGGTATTAGPWKLWSPDDPQRYALRFRVVDDAGELLDEHLEKFGVREFTADGDAFVLNGRPISIRGVLNWGYAPPSVAPSLDEDWMRDEIRFAQSRGFNLMKFCLWIPPKRYLELCDEMGMLAWMEYPTWHPKLDQDHLVELDREYGEFFEYDRNHASIVLRSLTCETGPSADVDVIRSLYEKCKSMIPGAIVEDDSSWISWNRIHDFYDDHPYGNNHTWVATLERLKAYIAAREAKPLALGEAIAADSWTVPTEEALDYARRYPAQAPWALADQTRWLAQMERLAARNGRRFAAAELNEQSRHYGHLMRKYQIEVYHREVPRGAYVVSVIRDFPKAAMGLIDYWGNPKQTPKDWSFHGDRMVLLRTDQDRRSFFSGETASIELLAKDLFGQERRGHRVQVALRDSAGETVGEFTIQNISDDIAAPLRGELMLPCVERPTRLTIEARWQAGEQLVAANQWPIWLFPRVADRVLARFHPSAQDLIGKLPVDVAPPSAAANSLVVTRMLDRELLGQLEKGANILLVPDNRPGSFPVQDHWFLRGSLAIFADDSAWHVPFRLATESEAESQNMLVELQHFDLSGPVVPRIDHYLETIDPLVLVWDHHDMREVRTHGLAFRLPVGAQGSLLVSTMNHGGDTNAAGAWLLDQWLRQTTTGKRDTEAAAQNLMQLQGELTRQILPLTDRNWRFRPDGEKKGQELGWQKAAFDDSSWESIGIDRHWESQGHAALDGWAWYRRRIELPVAFRDAEKIYLNFTGVDDYAEVYINGRLVATLGDLAAKQTAFDLRRSVDISSYVQPGEAIQVAIAVYDWYGAGGIFRPVSLSTEPLSDQPPILK